MPKTNATSAMKKSPRLEECKDLHKRLCIKKKFADALAKRFPMLRLTPRTERAFRAAVEYGEKLGNDKINDEELLAALTADITFGRFGAPDPSTLIASFGDVLSVAAAGVASGMTQGESMRFSVAIALCFSGGARGLRLKDRKTAAYYLGEVYKCGLETSLVAVYLDENFATLATDCKAQNIVARAAELKAEYVVLSLRDDGAVNDLKSRAAKLKTELAAACGATLLDHFVFDDGGYAAFDYGSACADGEINFIYYEK